MKSNKRNTEECKHQNVGFSNFCGADICRECELHGIYSETKGYFVQTFAKCFCGWPNGEQLEDDIEY